MQVNIDSYHINNSKCEKVLVIKIDTTLSFDDQIGNICKKTSAKLNTPTGVAQELKTGKKTLSYECLFVKI